MNPESSPPGAAASRAGSRAAHFALLAGLAALVPLPLVDAWLERRAHRAMYRAVAEEAGHPLEDTVLAVLAEDRSSVLAGCFGMAVIWPIKKLFRTFFYFLTVKDVIDGTAEATLRAAMLRSALVHLGPGGPHDARSVRDVMDTTLDRYNYSPVSRVFFRGERPDTEWVANTDGVDRAVGWIYQKSGGGAILATFLHRLAPAPVPQAPVPQAALPVAAAAVAPEDDSTSAEVPS